MNNFLSMVDKINASFDKADKCLIIRNREFIYIVDCQGQSYIIGEIDTNNICRIIVSDTEEILLEFKEEDSFKITNISNIGFIPVDGKDGIIGFGTSQCDCILFDNSDFCFIEFKFNAISLTERAIKKNRTKAVSQLGNTIELFDEKFSRDYLGLSLEGYVCTPTSYPREEAGWENFRVAFLEEYGIELFEKNEKSCK